jgi:hypothetical protein
MAAFALMTKLQIIVFIIVVTPDPMDHNTDQSYPLKNKLMTIFK